MLPAGNGRQRTPNKHLMVMRLGCDHTSTAFRRRVPLGTPFFSRFLDVNNAAVSSIIMLRDYRTPSPGNWYNSRAYDVLIAGTALARGLVATSNVGEFQRIDGLQVEDWR